MPTGRSRRTGPAGPLALLLLLSVLGLGACTARDTGPTPGAASGTVGSPTPTARPVRDVAGEVRRALERRAVAVRRDDARSFRAGLASRPAFVRQQRTYLANLAQLPLARFRYVVDPADVVRDGDRLPGGRAPAHAARRVRRTAGQLAGPVPLRARPARAGPAAARLGR